jgi:hypothetical protein
MPCEFRDNTPYFDKVKKLEKKNGKRIWFSII